VNMRRFFILLLAVLLAGISLRPASALQEITSVVESGFKPADHGFPFQNYGNDNSPVNLTTVEMRRLFGDVVCAGAIDKTAGTCKLTPPAQEWMEAVNKAMGGGHCDGMATLASVLYYNSIKDNKPDSFSGTLVPALELDKNELLQREIAYWFTTQFIPNVRALEIRIPPAEMVKLLTDGMSKKDGEHYTLGIYQPDGKGGHSITPTAIRKKSDDVYLIVVYDNNFPKEEKFIEVNLKTNTWTYFTASDPNEPGAKYEGNAETKSFSYTADSSRMGKMTCPFCDVQTAKINGLGYQAQGYNQLWLEGDNKAGSKLDLLITDDQGRKLGFVDGTLVNEIPGASYVIPRSGPTTLEDDQEPVYQIPVGVKFTVVLDASKATREEIANLTLIGPGHDVSIENIKVQPGHKDTAVFSPDGTKLTYTPAGGESPDIYFGVSTTGADYSFGVYGFDLDQGASVNAALDLTGGKFSVGTVGAKTPATYALYINRVDATIDQEYYHEGLTLDPQNVASIDFGKWDGKGDLTIGIDTNGDGTPDKTDTQANQPKPAK